ncbi:hypothetical protein F4558_004245 [Micromonospora profundi]|uniref:hypothetical protein n=1 Tax=Micromonospora profundi TaxID=1420889 RepID=UPI0014389415|nr:hypothetical protein [Micromonospora profundi]NJC14419.1 hypothetical protein [Micromonospora profundi]
MTDDFFELALVAMDKSGGVSERCDAISRMAELDSVKAKEILIGVASSWDEPGEILSQAGKSLGLLAAKAGYLSEWDLRDVTESAYEAYNEWLTLE